MRAEELDAVLLEDAFLVELEREVERRLAAPSVGKHRVRALASDDRFERVPLERLHVGARRQLRIGHDRGRVGVHEDDLVPLGAQALGSLRPRVVELAPLTDDDRPGADQEDFPDVGSARHERAS